MTTLSDTARVILSRASQHEMGLALPTDSLKGGALAKVADSLLKQKLVIAIAPSSRMAHAPWTIKGEAYALRITDEGMRAIGIDPNEGDANQGAPDAADEDAADDHGADDAEAPHGAHEGEEHGEGEGEGDEEPQDATIAAPRGNRLRDAAAAFLAAWDASPAEDATDNPISRAVEDLRAALAPKPARSTAMGERKPREGTKRETVIALLKRGEGATVDAIMDATDWQAHTVRGFFASLKKAGWHISTTEVPRPAGDKRRGMMLVYRA